MLSPCGESLFFACAKKSNQKKAHPAYAPSALRAPGPRIGRDSRKGHPAPAANGAHPCAPPLRGFSRPIRRCVRDPESPKQQQQQQQSNRATEQQQGREHERASWRVCCRGCCGLPLAPVICGAAPPIPAVRCNSVGTQVPPKSLGRPHPNAHRQRRRIGRGPVPGSARCTGRLPRMALRPRCANRDTGRWRKVCRFRYSAAARQGRGSAHAAADACGSTMAHCSSALAR
ncbi:hypothetical protein HEP73_00748 [Xanthomonas sp. GW]|nr:hypothetical protein HEP73_00748 [Xanthomonas sp. GW]